MCCGDQPCHAHVKHALSRLLGRYGQLVATYPWPFVVLPLLVFGGLGAGLVRVEMAGRTDDLFLPRYSQGFKDRETVQHLFPDRTRDFYDALELNEEQIMGSLIIRARHNQSVYDPHVIAEIRDLIANVKANVTVKVGEEVLLYQDLCGRHDNSCVVTGERLLSAQFDAMRGMGILTYPKWRLPTTNESVDLSFALADSDTLLQRVGAVRVTFKLRHDEKEKSLAWEDAFVQFVQRVETNNTDIAFSSSQSFRQELYADFNGDKLFFWVSLGLMTLCACVACAGCDVVSTRALLTVSGVLSATAGTVGGFGLLSLCGVKLVDMAWVTPFLVLSLRLYDTLLLMSAWRETLSDTELRVPQRVGEVLTSAGVAITVTSLSVFAAFAIGYTSSFMVVANFCLYTGVAVAFSYICTMTVSVGCLGLHAHRVYASRHCLTCCATKPRDQLRKEGRLLCTALFCGGSVPRENGDDQSPCETIMQTVLKNIVNNSVARVIVVLLFLGYLAVSIYGVTSLHQEVKLKTLVPESSYFYKYITWDSMYFGFSFPVIFYLKPGVVYDEQTAQRVERLIVTAKQDEEIEDEFQRCWLIDFLKSKFYNASETDSNFSGSAVEDFLVETKTFLGDVVMDEDGDSIIASRCFVFSEKIKDPNQLADLMGRMRTVAGNSGLSVFAFHPVFLNYEQLLDVLPTALQTVGVAVGALCVFSILFMPQLIVVCVATLSCVSVLVGVFGFISLWDVSLSVFTINHLIMSAGFAVLLSVPTCSAYFMSQATDAIARAAVAIFITGTCAAVSVLPLLATRCFFFDVFFKAMLLATLCGAVNGGLFVPVILSLIGHKDTGSRGSQPMVHKNSKGTPSSTRSSKQLRNGNIYEGNTVNCSSIPPTADYYNGVSPANFRDLDTQRNNTESHYHVPEDYELMDMPKARDNSGRVMKKKGKDSGTEEKKFNVLSGGALYANGMFVGGPGANSTSVYANDNRTAPLGVYDTPLSVNTQAPRDRSPPPVAAKPYRSITQHPKRPASSFPVPSPRRETSRSQTSSRVGNSFPEQSSRSSYVLSEPSFIRHGDSPYEPYYPPRKSVPDLSYHVRKQAPEPSFPHRKSLPENRSYHAQGHHLLNQQIDRSTDAPRGERHTKPRPPTRLPSMGRHDSRSGTQTDSNGEGAYVNQAFVNSAASLESRHHVSCNLSSGGGLASSQAYVTENFRDYPL